MLSYYYESQLLRASAGEVPASDPNGPTQLRILVPGSSLEFFLSLLSSFLLRLGYTPPNSSLHPALSFILTRSKFLFTNFYVDTMAGVAQLSGLSAGLLTERSPVRFPVRAHAWVVGLVPS